MEWNVDKKNLSGKSWEKVINIGSTGGSPSRNYCKIIHIVIGKSKNMQALWKNIFNWWKDISHLEINTDIVENLCIQDSDVQKLNTAEDKNIFK